MLPSSPSQNTDYPSVKKDKEPQKKILSKTAQAMIAAALASGTYEKRKDRVEPPYMAPSTDTDLYSSVRSLLIRPVYYSAHYQIVVLPVQRLWHYPGALLRM